MVVGFKEVQVSDNICGIFSNLVQKLDLLFEPFSGLILLDN